MRTRVAYEGPRHVSPYELALRLQVSIRTLDRWRIAGTGPAWMKLNGRIRYRLEDVIAVGGMGQVWRARDETLERPVAVKVVRPGAANRETFLERFRAEARNSAALQHPNIVTVHDFGEGEESAYLVMELIDGEPLSTILERRGPLPV